MSGRRWLTFSLWCIASGCLAWSAFGASANLTWIPSSDPAVTGYNIYYGTSSQQYTNVISVGNVSSATISGLNDGTMYYFAGTAHDAFGNQSDYSNEAAFNSLKAASGSTLRLTTLTTNRLKDQLTFSLAAGTPAGVTINATNGQLSWNPSHSFSMTTNTITVLVTDNSNPALSMTETLVVTVSDYLELGAGAVAVQAGRVGSVPLTVAANESAANLQFTLTWPVSQLGTPVLTCGPSVVASSMQNQSSNLVIQLQFAPGQTFTNATQVAQLNFHAAPNQPSAFLSLRVSSAAGLKANATLFSNVMPQSGEVAVVGNNPLLRPQATSSQGRTLSVYGNPGVTNQLQFTTSFVPPIVWTPVVTFPQTSLVQNINLGSADPVIFYRLQQL